MGGSGRRRPRAPSMEEMMAEENGGPKFAGTAPGPAPPPAPTIPKWNRRGARYAQIQGRRKAAICPPNMPNCIGQTRFPGPKGFDKLACTLCTIFWASVAWYFKTRQDKKKTERAAKKGDDKDKDMNTSQEKQS